MKNAQQNPTLSVPDITYLPSIISYHMAEYAQCQFYDALFREPQARTPSGYTQQVEEHVMPTHHKVRVRKGSNYRWMDEGEAKKMTTREGTRSMKRSRGD